MEARERNLVQLFDSDIQFRIPLFQRAYVWDETRQWEPLWSDVERVADQILSSGERNVASHFLGAIVVSLDTFATGDLQIREVVDGQQRLTTLQLLIDAVEEVIRDCGCTPQSHRLRPLLLNDTNRFQAEDRFKVRPTSVDQAPFLVAMDDDREIDLASAETRIVQAHEFFKNRVRTWACEDESQDESRQNTKFKALVTAIRSKLCVVSIDLSSSDDEHAIFETLNARGTPLLQYDLVKNHLLLQAKRHDLDVEGIYNQYWKHFDDHWWKQEVTLGRLTWPRLDAFLYYWIGMHRADTVSSQRLFASYQELVQNEGWDPIDVASDFSRYSRIFRDLESDEHSGSDTTFFERRKLLNLRVLTPILLWLFGQNECPGTTRRHCLQLLESWFMRRVLCGGGTQGYQNFLHPLLRNMKKCDISECAEVVASTLRDATAQGAQWPTDADIRSAVLNRPVYTAMGSDRLRAVLEAIEDLLRATDEKMEESCPQGLQIEHIMPKGWRDFWPLPDTVEHSHEAGEDRDAMIHTLGNLTLVNEKLNPSMSNEPWREKRDQLDKHSVLRLNRELVRVDSWDEDAIRARGEKLARRICRIWPYAEA